MHELNTQSEYAAAFLRMTIKDAHFSVHIHSTLCTLSTAELSYFDLVLFYAWIFLSFHAKQLDLFVHFDELTQFDIFFMMYLCSSRIAHYTLACGFSFYQQYLIAIGCCCFFLLFTVFVFLWWICARCFLTWSHTAMPLEMPHILGVIIVICVCVCAFSHFDAKHKMLSSLVQRQCNSDTTKNKTKGKKMDFTLNKISVCCFVYFFFCG